MLDILEDSDEEYETYFKKPEQLEEIFLNLEEKNLFLITNTKEREQQVEDMKHHFDKRKVEMEQSKEYLIKQKNELQKQIDVSAARALQLHAQTPYYHPSFSH